MEKSSNIELDIDKIKKLGEERENENVRLRSFLKMKDPDWVDRMFHSINEDVTFQIDCTECGNCCKGLAPSVDSKDIQRLSKTLNLSESEVKEKYTEKDEFNDMFFKHRPCSFLTGKLCSIYENRPNDCASYPHLHKDEISSRLWGIIDNYSVCPIVFNVLEIVKQRVRFR